MWTLHKCLVLELIMDSTTKFGTLQYQIWYCILQIYVLSLGFPANCLLMFQ